MTEKTGIDQNGISYRYHSCSCGEEFLDMEQLHEAAEKYRALKKYRVKLTKWGVSRGIRIPKELLKKYKFSNEVNLIPEEDGIRMTP
jgi:hypothetical protein